MNKNTLITMAILMTLFLPFTYGGCGGGGGSSNDGQFYAEEPFFDQVAIDTQDRFFIQAVAGSIEITGSSTVNSVTIEGERRVGSSSPADAETYLDQLQVQIKDLGNEVTVETIQPKFAHGRNYEVDYRITIPDHLEVYVSQVGGTVVIDSINSPVSVNAFAGDVDLVEISGSTVVNVINGEITSQVTLPSDGILELSTMTGNIDSQVALPLGGTIDITVLHGDIHLDIPQNTSATLSADLIKGFIQLVNLVLQNEVRTSYSLTGTFGNGQGDIWLETETGNITVTGF
jgi:hypothetical protein